MRLRTFLSQVGETYDPAAGFDTSAQALLRDAAEHLRHHAPIGYRVHGSGGQRPLRTTTTPWIGFFDPEETTTPREGLYVVYLLRADRSAWTAVILMGTELLAEHMHTHARTERRGSGAEKAVLARLRSEAAAIREALGPETRGGWDDSIDLRINSIDPPAKGMRQARYEAATILASTYDLPDLPNEERLRSELRRLLVAYERAIEAKRRLAATNPAAISTVSEVVPSPAEDVRYIFAPRTDVVAEVETNGAYTRTPRHETGLGLYGQWLTDQGHRVTNNRVHPRDFLVVGPTTWLGEYKVVYGGHETRASREAHSQLKEYAYFLHREAAVGLLAVFSEPISPERVAWLLHEDIESVWFDGVDWRGTPGATSAGLARP